MVQAQNPAKEAFIEAEGLTKIKKYKKAIEKYEEAYRLAPRAVLLFHIAHTYEIWERYDEALDMYGQYLKEAGPQEEEIQLAHGRIQGIKDKLAKTGIYIDFDEHGAQVYIDNTYIGDTPLKKVIGVAPGPHRVKVKKEGLEEYNTKARVPAGKVHSIKPILITSMIPPPPPPPPPKPPTHTLAYVFMGIGGAMIVSGGSMGIWYVADDDAPDAAVYSMHGLIWPGLAAIIAGSIIYGVEEEDYEDEILLYRLRYGKVVGGSSPP